MKGKKGKCEKMGRKSRLATEGEFSIRGTSAKEKKKP